MCTLRLQVISNLNEARYKPGSGSSYTGIGWFSSLRSLQVGGWVWRTELRTTHHATVMKTFSTITSPAFSELIIVFQESGIMADLLPELALFQTLRWMNKIMPLKLVILLESMGHLQEDRLEMEEVVLRFP